MKNKTKHGYTNLQRERCKQLRNLTEKVRTKSRLLHFACYAKINDMSEYYFADHLDSNKTMLKCCLQYCDPIFFKY